MKHFRILVGCLALVAAGCGAGEESAIHILQSFPLLPGASGGQCAVGTNGILAGSLDISATTIYLLQFGVESTIQQIDTTVSPDTVAGPDRNIYIANQLALTYASSPQLSLPSENIPIFFSVLPQGAATSGAAGGFFRLDLISANLAQRLLNSVGPGSSVTVYITLQLQGNLISGQKLNSNRVTYPITVFNSGFGGCPGDVPLPSGPCNLPGGQDGSQVGCCKQFKGFTGCPTGP